jgi:hypothetical protein
LPVEEKNILMIEKKTIYGLREAMAAIRGGNETYYGNGQVE